MSLVIRGRDSKGGYYTSGISTGNTRSNTVTGGGKGPMQPFVKYYYEIGNPKSRESAKKKAMISSLSRSKTKLGDNSSYRKKISYRHTSS